MDNRSVGTEEMLDPSEQRSLPVALKGYDRLATDRLLNQLAAELRTTQRLHSNALARVEELERRVAEGEEREKAVIEALVVASQVRTESEREGKELREKYTREGEAITARAKGDADEIVKEAVAEAAEIVEEARSKAGAFEQRIRDADQLAQLVHNHMTAFLQSLLAEVERRSVDSGSVVADLLGRAGEMVEAGRGGAENGWNAIDEHASVSPHRDGTSGANGATGLEPVTSAVTGERGVRDLPPPAADLP
jgi:cell division septum initiation protein DivIVA